MKERHFRRKSSLVCSDADRRRHIPMHTMKNLNSMAGHQSRLTTFNKFAFIHTLQRKTGHTGHVCPLSLSHPRRASMLRSFDPAIPKFTGIVERLIRGTTYVDELVTPLPSPVAAHVTHSLTSAYCHSCFHASECFAETLSHL